MNASVPAVLAVSGIGLMALAVFGPFRRTPARAEDASDAGATLPAGAPWPVLVEASATACDVHARIDLAEGLGALRSPWAESVLRKAYESETDATVRSAIEAALSPIHSLVS